MSLFSRTMKSSYNEPILIMDHEIKLNSEPQINMAHEIKLQWASSHGSWNQAEQWAYNDHGPWKSSYNWPLMIIHGPWHQAEQWACLWSTWTMDQAECRWSCMKWNKEWKWMSSTRTTLCVYSQRIVYQHEQMIFGLQMVSTGTITKKENLTLTDR